MRFLPNTPSLPNVGAQESVYDGVLNRRLWHILGELLAGHNGAVFVDGQNPMTAPLPLAVYTVAGVPSAALWTGALIHVSNEAGGAVTAFSDGTNWRRVTDRAVIS